MTWPPLRSERGGRPVATALGATDPAGIVAACLARVPLSATIEVADAPSRARPAARGRYAAGLITLFPAAFADPLTLAWTVLHELGHAAGLDEAGAEHLAASHLGIACSP